MVRVYEILPHRLYVSARTAAMTTQEKRRAVRTPGITAVVNLWHTPDEEMRKLCLSYSHHPLTDGRNINIALVRSAVDEVINYLDAENCVLVHCYGGRNRAGLVCSLALCRILGIDGRTAAEMFVKARPNSLVNRHFKKFLDGVPAP